VSLANISIRSSSGFEAPAELENLEDVIGPHDEQTYAVGAYTFVAPIENTDNRLYVVKLIIRRAASTEGELWGVIDLPILLKEYFERSNQDIYHYLRVRPVAAIVETTRKEHLR